MTISKHYFHKLKTLSQQAFDNFKSATKEAVMDEYSLNFEDMGNHHRALEYADFKHYMDGRESLSELDIFDFEI